MRAMNIPDRATRIDAFESIVIVAGLTLMVVEDILIHFFGQ